MIINNKRNLCTTYDLTKDELERIYRGCGMATVVTDDNMNILTCFYHGRNELPKNDEAPISFTKKIFSLSSNQLDGMMSCGQFCLLE